jgi:hypothetical protein
MLKPLDGWVGSIMVDLAVVLSPLLVAAVFGRENLLPWLLVALLVAVSALAMVAGIGLQAEEDRMHSVKIDVEGGVIEASGMAYLVVVNRSGTRATFEATVEEVNEVRYPYAAGWGDQGNASVSIAPGSTARVNVAWVGRHDADGPIHVCPTMASTIAGTDRFLSHDPKHADQSRAVRFVIDVSSPDYPHETDRITSEIGVVGSDGSGAFHRVVDRAHLVKGASGLST